MNSAKILRQTSTEAFHRQFEKAVKKSDGEENYCYKIAGQNLLLRLAGHKLKPLLFSALAHAEAEPFDTAAFTLSVWEGRSTQTYPPLLNLDNNAYLKGENLIALRHDNYFYFIDYFKKEAFVCITDMDEVPLHEIAAPLKTVFHWWLRSEGRQIIHAAAMGKRSGGLLLTGKSGCGKSTAALACLSSTVHLMADDFVIVYFENEKFFASPLYSSAKIHKKCVGDFSYLEKLDTKVSKWENDEKSLFFLHPYFADKMIGQFSLKTIAVAHYTKKEKTTIEEISSIAALSAIAPHTLLQLPDAGAVEFENLKRLVKSLPCYQLNTGTRLAEIPDHIKKLLESV